MPALLTRMSMRWPSSAMIVLIVVCVVDGSRKSARTWITLGTAPVLKPLILSLILSTASCDDGEI